MSPSVRPEGTDGSDHEFRQQIDDIYKGLPLWRAAGWLALHFSAIPITLKVAFSLTAASYLGVTPQIAPVAIATVYILALISWNIAAPATYRESFKWIKITTSLILIAAAMHVVTMYKYHIMLPKQQLYPRRLWKLLSEEKGWTGEYWLDLLTTMEALGDGGCVVTILGCCFALNGFITRKMALERRLKEFKEETGEEIVPAEGKKPAAKAGARRRAGKA